MFHTIGIVGKPDDAGIASTVSALIKFLQPDFQVLIDFNSKAALDLPSLPVYEVEELSRRCDLLIAVGGDGTFLTAARHAAQHNIPVVGINLGQLGFLVDISPSELSTQLQGLLAGQYREECRTILQAQVLRDGKIIHEETAVNEVAIHRWVTPSMIGIITEIDGVLLNSQRSDGLIVATPTGSTAYALSAGGPILHPSLSALVLVPLNPHTLSNRSIVIQDSAEINISFKQTKQINAMVTCDHIEIPDVRISDKIVIRKHIKPIRILHPKGYDYFQVLRTKLNWSGGHA